MIPVTQTRFGYPDGNCWEACLASILDAIGDKIVHNPHPGRSDWGWRGLSGVIGFEIFIPVQLARMPWRTEEWQGLNLKEASA